MGGRGVLLGGVPGVAAANVMVIGAGAVGINAAQIAVGMAADMFLFDLNIDALRTSRPAVRRLALDRLQLDALDRGDAPAHGPGDRRRARPGRSRSARDQARAARADEAERGARRRRDRPGRLLRDLEADDPLRPGLRGRRDHPLLRRQHARRRARSPRPTRSRTRPFPTCSRSPTTASRARSTATRACVPASTSPRGKVTHKAVAEGVGAEYVPVEEALGYPRSRRRTARRADRDPKAGSSMQARRRTRSE